MNARDRTAGTWASESVLISKLFKNLLDRKRCSSGAELVQISGNRQAGKDQRSTAAAKWENSKETGRSGHASTATTTNSSVIGIHHAELASGPKANVFIISNIWKRTITILQRGKARMGVSMEMSPTRVVKKEEKANRRSLSNQVQAIRRCTIRGLSIPT